MWISQKLSKEKNTSKNITAEVTDIEKGNIKAQGSNEYRDISTIAPTGLSYGANQGDKCLLIPINNTVVSLGNKMVDKSLEEGEIMLYSGEGSIVLKNDGKILINGQVFINGEKY